MTNYATCISCNLPINHSIVKLDRGTFCTPCAISNGWIANPSLTPSMNAILKDVQTKQLYNGTRKRRFRR